MLDGIRGKAQSWVTKIIFAIIIIVFVFWGVSNPGGMRSGSLAKVNGEHISVRDFDKFLRNAAQAELRRTPDLLSNPETFAAFKEMLLESMIESALVRQEATRLGIAVTPHELKLEIASRPEFQNESGVFDPDRYVMLLEANGLTPGEFEASVLNDTLYRKLIRYVALSAGMSDEEARLLYFFTLENRVADFVLFSPDAFVKDVVVSDLEVESYYTANKERFRLPVRGAIEFLRLTPDSLARGYAVSDEEAEAFYEKNIAMFQRPASFESRHIFVAAPPDDSTEPGAAELLAKAREKVALIEERLAKGEDFRTLAAEFSEDPGTAQNGGLLGWIELGSMGGLPEFEAAAMALEPGEVSKPVRTMVGFHIIRLDNKKEAFTVPFAEAKAEIVTLLGREKADEDFENILKAAEEGLSLNTPFADLGSKFHSEVEHTELLPQQDLESKLGLHSDARQSFVDALAASAAEGKPFTLPVPLNIRDGVALIRITEGRASEIPPLADVRDAILTTLRADKALIAARAAAEAALPSFTGTEIPAAFKDRVQQSKNFQRVFPAVAPLGNAQDLVDALFGAQVGVWLPNIYETPSGPVIARLAAVEPVSEAQWDQYKGIFLPQARQRQAQGVAQAFLLKLRNNAEISVDQKLLDSLGTGR